jgi:uncharacterized protein
MEVQRVGKASINKLQAKEEVAKDSIAFQEMMKKQRTSITFDRLNQRMKEIEDQGKKLVNNQTVENLRKYKKMIKDFMDESIKNGLQLDQHRGFNQRGSTKVYTLVKQVDKKLVELTDTVLDKEQKGLSILSLVGEIEGLLINIYT